MNQETKPRTEAEIAWIKDTERKPTSYIESLEDALIWCSGSQDFQEGGIAREGWLKVCKPLLDKVGDNLLKPRKELIYSQADMDDKLKEFATSVESSIWDDEQECQSAINNDPTNSWICGRLLGLQRSRDIIDEILAKYLKGE